MSATVTSLTYPTASVLVLGGLPAVGKSTLIARLLGHVKIVEIDVHRARLGPRPDGEAVKQAVLADLRAHMALAGPVVLDTTALFEGRDELAGYITGAGREAHLLVLDGDRALVEAGLAARERQVPASVIDNYMTLWEELKAEIASGAVLADGFASCRVLDRAAANQLTSIRFGEIW